MHKGKYSTAIIVSLQLFLSEPARTVNGTYIYRASRDPDRRYSVHYSSIPLYALVCVCVCVCVCACARACILCIEGTSSLLPIPSPVQ